MKLVTFRLVDGVDRVGALAASENAVVDLSAHFPSMLALIDGGPAALDLARGARVASRTVHPLAEVALRAPLPEPRQMRDAMCFERHLRQSMAGMAGLRYGRLGRVAAALGLARVPPVFYAQPLYYKCNRFSVVGPGADIEWPVGASLMDYECEVAVVIGTRGKNIARERAMDHVFGYTIFNDMTARDLQSRETSGYLGPAKGKDFDTGNVLGPWLVTRDEVLDPYALTMISRVNGVEWGRGHSGDMHHRWDTLIAHVSKNETLHPGEVLGSGTVGNGCGLERGTFLAPGAVVELEVTGLGTLRNRLLGPAVDEASR